MDIGEIIDMIAQVNGDVGCVTMAIEESSKLIQACSKWLRFEGIGVPTNKEYYEVIDNLYEELADSMITICELAYALGMNDPRLVETCNKKLIRRLKGIISNESDDIEFREKIIEMRDALKNGKVSW